MRLKKMCLNINGADRMFVCDPEKDTLASVLRRLGLTGTKIGCGTGVCGACSVILNGKVIRSCMRKIRTMDEYSTVITIEGIGTPNHLHPLQVAFMTSGAVHCGFCTPGFIVSAYGLLQENNNPTREEVRDWFQQHRNACRCTGYKQIVDAVVAAAKVVRGEAAIEDISFKEPNEEGYYGKPVPRPTALAKVCGVADYGDDVELKMPPETLHVALVQPKVASHAKILKLDYSEAEKMPGVVKVITHKDVKGTNQMDLFTGTPRSTGITASRKYLAVDKINMYGDVVALVAADTKDHAREAAAKVRLEIEQLPEYTDYLDAVVPDAVRIHKETPNIYAEWPLFKGDHVAETIDSSAYSVEGSFYSTRQPHMSIEGDTVQAYWDEDGFLTVQCKSQAVYWNKMDIAQAAGVDPEKVRVITNTTGASFGWSVTAASFALAAIATVATDMPVALSMSYEEFMHFSGKRAASYSNARLGFDKDGKITAAEYDIGLDHGAYCELGADLINRPIRFFCFPYVVPKAVGLSRVAVTNHGFGTAYRGYGSPQAYTASEALMDIMAEKIGMDPFEIRWRNIARPGDRNLQGYEFQQYPMEEIMLKMKPIYEKAVAEAKAKDTPEKRRGVGLAWGGYNVSETPFDVATVALELNKDNTIIKYDTWHDLGQGGDIGSLMVTLEALKPLGIKPGQVKLIQNDTKNCPDSGIAASSRSHFMDGRATQEAAKKLLDAMRKADGAYRTYDEMVAEGIPTKYEGTQENSAVPGLKPMDPNTGIGSPSISYTYALFMAEVEVNTAAGKTTVLKYTCVDDVGVIGNILSVNGQAYSGISHCIGFALSEDYRDVRKQNNIYSCGIPYIKDIPDEINVIHCENPRELGPFGSSGASEAFQSAGHMAVINAINNACGVRIFSLPATPEKVKAGLDILAAGRKIEPPKKYYLGPDMYEELEKIKANPV
ncbi:MAG TPA: molybdopterin cofactor-binding domain-containing protein [Anaerovoracaceae bacterium]|nr:molybdopterin cofactor-binding domain-containing protein [Anaerovoracaceae bacterium]